MYLAVALGLVTTWHTLTIAQGQLRELLNLLTLYHECYGVLKTKKIPNKVDMSILDCRKVWIFGSEFSIWKSRIVMSTLFGIFFGKFSKLSAFLTVIP